MGISFAKSKNNKAHKPQKLNSYAEMEEVMSQGMVSSTVSKVREIQGRMFLLDAESEERKALEKEKNRLKGSLPVFCFQGEFDGERKNESARSNGLVMYDGDHFRDMLAQMVAEGRMECMPDLGKESAPVFVYRRFIEGREDELQIAFVSLSCSGDGLRAVFVKPEGMDVEEAQRWFCEKVGLPGDECVKDLARCSFVTPKEDVLYVSEERLFHTPIPGDDDPANVTNRMGKRGSSAKKKDGGTAVASVSAVALAVAHNPDLAIEGVKVGCIIPRYWKHLKQKGIIKGDAPVEGERHLALMTFAQDFAPFVNNDPSLLRAAMPQIEGKDAAEVDAIVRDKVEYMVSNGITKRSREVSDLIKELKGQSVLMDAYPTLEECVEFEAGLPKNPKCCDVAMKILAPGYRFPALIVLLGVVMCLADGVKAAMGLFDPDRLRALIHIDAWSGVGKSLVFKPARAVMKTFMERNAKAEDERRRDMRNSSAASAGKKDSKNKADVAEKTYPDLRFMPQATTDNAQLEISRHGRTMLTQEEELEAGVRQFKKSSYDRAPRLIPAFDGTSYGNLTGVAASVNGSAQVNWIWESCGTRSALFSLVKWHGNENDGLTNRLSIGVLPLSFSDDKLVAKYSAKDLENLRYLGEIFMRMEGELSSPRLNKAMDKWKKTFAGEAADIKDAVKRGLTGRVAFIAFRFASAMQLLYIADKVIAQEKSGKRDAGERIDVSQFAEPKEIAEWGVVFADYFLDKQWSIFGTNMVKRVQESFSSVIVTRRGACKWLDKVGEEFTYDDVRKALCLPSVTSTVRVMVKRAREKGLVEVVNDDYKKPVFRKKMV